MKCEIFYPTSVHESTLKESKLLVLKKITCKNNTKIFVIVKNDTTKNSYRWPLYVVHYLDVHLYRNIMKSLIPEKSNTYSYKCTNIVVLIRVHKSQQSTLGHHSPLVSVTCGPCGTSATLYTFLLYNKYWPIEHWSVFY